MTKTPPEGALVSGMEERAALALKCATTTGILNRSVLGRQMNDMGDPARCFAPQKKLGPDGQCACAGRRRFEESDATLFKAIIHVYPALCSHTSDLRCCF